MASKRVGPTPLLCWWAQWSPGPPGSHPDSESRPHSHVPICTYSTLLDHKLPSPPPSPGRDWLGLQGEGWVNEVHGTRWAAEKEDMDSWLFSNGVQYSHTASLIHTGVDPTPIQVSDPLQGQEGQGEGVCAGVAQRSEQASLLLCTCYPRSEHGAPWTSRTPNTDTPSSYSEQVCQARLRPLENGTF